MARATTCAWSGVPRQPSGPCQQVMRRTSQEEDRGAVVDQAAPPELLGGHVARRPEGAVAGQDERPGTVLVEVDQAHPRALLVVQEAPVVQVTGDPSGRGDGDVCVEDLVDRVVHLRERQPLERLQRPAVGPAQRRLVQHPARPPRVDQRDPLGPVQYVCRSDEDVVLHRTVQGRRPGQRRPRVRGPGRLDEPALTLALESPRQAPRVVVVEDRERALDPPLLHRVMVPRGRARPTGVGRPRCSLRDLAR